MSHNRIRYYVISKYKDSPEIIETIRTDKQIALEDARMLHEMFFKTTWVREVKE